MSITSQLTDPKKLCSYSQAYVGRLRLSNPCNIPEVAGVYALYFKEMPPLIPENGCFLMGNKALLYVGEAKNLHKRIKQHYEHTAAESSLRMSLGVIILDQKDFPLRKAGLVLPGFRFSDEAENLLSEWMQENVFVCWAADKNHKATEKDIIENNYLPLNIKNSKHPFSKKLRVFRKLAEEKAKRLLPLTQVR